MKLLHLSFLLALFLAVTEGRSLQDDWTIAGPIASTGIVLSGNSLSLTYTVSDAMTDDNIKAPTIWDKGCKAGENQKEEEAGFDVSVASLSATNSDDRKTSVVTIALTPKLIANDGDLYGPAANGKDGKIDFCFRYMSKTESDTEVNFVELLVSINVDLSQGIELDNVTVKPKDKDEATRDKQYAVEAFLCDLSTAAAATTTNTIPSPEVQTGTDAFEQGSLVTVCVAPDDASRVDGIVMKSINDFTWERTDDNNIQQPAIENDNAATNELTSLACTAKDYFCHFSSVLSADFYKTSGEVTGLGSATMEFGSPLLPIASFDNEFDRTACGCNGDGDGPINQVPASSADGDFKNIIEDYITKTDATDATSSRFKYGNKIGCWDVGLVTNMRGAFQDQYAFNEPLGCWNMESVNSMQYMFLNAHAFNQDISAWVVSSVNNMNDAFKLAYAFNQDISAWNVALVTNMFATFFDARAFNQDIGAWNVASVNIMNVMFYGAHAFNQNLCMWNIQDGALTNNYYGGDTPEKLFLDSGCPIEDAPSDSAMCQSCESRRLTTTATATDDVGKPKKPANNNNDRNRNSNAKSNIVTRRVLQEDATASAATAVSSEFDISIGVSKSDNNYDGVDALRTAAAGDASLGMIAITLVSIFGGLIGSAILFA